jgi:hypothetical protein
MRLVPDDTPIWRYMRLAPFIEMIMNFALFQTRVSEFDDPLEGAYGYREAVIRPDVIQSLDPPQRMTYHIYSRQPRPDDSMVTAHPVTPEDTIREARLRSCVTCWYHHDQTESYAMWRVYGSDSFAVAIETTVGALRNAFSASANAVIGGVEYSPLPSEVNSVHELFFHKRPEFATEREIRSVHVFQERLPGAAVPQRLSAPQMNILLSRIIAAPGMRETMYNSLRSLVAALFEGQGITFNVDRFQRSALDNDQLPQTSAGATIVRHGADAE